MSITNIGPDRCRGRVGERSPAVIDRRGAARFEAVADRAWIGWWDGDGVRTVASRLLNISRTGAALVSPEAPAAGGIAWFCVSGPSWSGGARARVVGVEPIGPGEKARVRLAFVNRCSDDLYQIALGLIRPAVAS